MLARAFLWSLVVFAIGVCFVAVLTPVQPYTLVPPPVAHTPKAEVPVDFEDSDEVTVFYAEHILARWKMDGTSWTAFHSGFRFVNERTGKMFHIDYVPQHNANIKLVLAPEIVPNSDPTFFQRVLKVLGVTLDAKMIWTNGGHVNFYTESTQYTNFTRLATTDGAMFHKMFQWGLDYNKTYNTFDPVEIVVAKNASKHIPSRVCHDLVSDGLWYMYENGVTIKPAKLMFRDHILMYADDFISYTQEEVDSNWLQLRSRVLTFYHMFDSNLPAIKKEFTGVRMLLVNAAAAVIQPFIRIEGVYHRVTMAEPYVNYCYMQVR
jgi:hypothetical protein